jgi:hypothetical protein
MPACSLWRGRAGLLDEEPPALDNEAIDLSSLEQLTRGDEASINSLGYDYWVFSFTG